MIRGFLMYMQPVAKVVLIFFLFSHLNAFTAPPEHGGTTGTGGERYGAKAARFRDLLSSMVDQINSSQGSFTPEEVSAFKKSLKDLREDKFVKRLSEDFNLKRETVIPFAIESIDPEDPAIDGYLATFKQNVATADSPAKQPGDAEIDSAAQALATLFATQDGKLVVEGSTAIDKILKKAESKKGDTSLSKDSQEYWKALFWGAEVAQAVLSQPEAERGTELFKRADKVASKFKNAFEKTYKDKLKNHNSEFWTLVKNKDGAQLVEKFGGTIGAFLAANPQYADEIHAALGKNLELENTNPWFKREQGHNPYQRLFTGSSSAQLTEALNKFNRGNDHTKSEVDDEFRPQGGRLGDFRIKKREVPSRAEFGFKDGSKFVWPTPGASSGGVTAGSGGKKRTEDASPPQGLTDQAAKDLIVLRCIKCHGPRGTSTKFLKATGELGEGADAKDMARRLRSTDPKVQMPRGAPGALMTGEEKAQLAAWLDKK